MRMDAHPLLLAVYVPGLAEAAAAEASKIQFTQAMRLHGDVCPIPLQADFKQSFGAPLRLVWGSTEAWGSLTYALRPGPVSRIVPGAQVRLVDDGGQTVRRGDVGEFLVRGRGVATGYRIGPGLVENLAPDGWFHSGDLMRQGDNDELWFVGRKKELRTTRQMTRS